MTPTKTLTVSLSGARSYPIHIGQDLLPHLGALITDRLAAKRVFLIQDAAVVQPHGEIAAQSLAQAGFTVVPVTVPSGEASKCYAQFERLCERLIENAAERRDLVVALGGGVLGDLAGFVAASVLRGLRLVQVPTTLLSQVDSSVGGKTGINSPQGKNLIGAFKQPELVVIDHRVLDTLPRRELIAGLAEVIKYGCINRPDFFGWLEGNVDRVLDRDAAALDEAIAVSCQTKADVVAADETERTGQRALLNLGHTFGHALEAEAGYNGALLHGEAVAIGMSLAFDLSARLGFCPQDDPARLRSLLDRAALPTGLRTLSNIPMTSDRLLAHMSRDKKVVDGVPQFILARGIGAAFQAATADVDAATVRALLEDYLMAHG